MNSTNNQNPLHNSELERALKKRAKEYLERKAVWKAINEYIYEKYLKRQNKPKHGLIKLRKKYIKLGIYFIVMTLIIILYAYLQN